MSKQTLFKTFYLCLFMISFCILSAQEGDQCVLPPPGLLEVTQVTTTSISVEWTAVPGAVAYQVITKETDTGIIVDQTITPNLSYTVNTLIPDTNYTIEVRASACPDGPWGAPISLERSTSIIVVDIVMHLQDCSPTSVGGQYYDGDIIEEVTSQTEETILVDGAFLGSPIFQHDERFSFVVNTDLMATRTKAGINPGVVQKTKLKSSIGTFIEAFHPHKHTGVLHKFADIFITYNPRFGGSADVDIVWKTDVYQVDVSHCATVQFAENEDIAGLQAAESSNTEIHATRLQAEENTTTQPELNISPNPSTSYINVEGVEKGQVIDVLDLQGRSWYRQMNDGINTSIDVSNLPSGTYMLRTIIDKKPVIRRFVKV